MRRDCHRHCRVPTALARLIHWAWRTRIDAFAESEYIGQMPELTVSPQARKDLRRLPKQDRSAITERLNAYAAIAA